MKRHRFVPWILVLLVTLGVASVAPAGEFIARFLEFYRTRPYPVDHFAPGNYGYNLDDQSRGYFGGGRYTEYYNYGRGGNLSNLANFPGPAPGPAWLYDNRNWIGTQPVRPFLPYPNSVATPLSQALPRPVRVVPPGAAMLCVECPPEATVWLEGQPMRQSGAVREYVSPSLEPGVSYTYSVRARWLHQGQPLEQVQSVEVQAGQTRVVVFQNQATAAPSLKTPGLLPPELGEQPVVVPKSTTP